MKMKLKLPLYVTIPRKTKADRVLWLNLNVYRNTHYLVLNQAKAEYARLVGAALAGMRPDRMDPPPYRFRYTIYPATARAFDLANVAPIVQKFTDDALITLGIIPEDNHKIIPAIEYAFGAVDRANPRAELEIDHEFVL